MDLEEIEKAIQLMQKYGLQEFKWKKEDGSIFLTKPSVQSAPVFPGQVVYPDAMQSFSNSPIPSPVAESPAKEVKASKKENIIEIRSPFVGTYYTSSAPGASNFVNVGQRVRTGDTLCIVEAMKLMNEIEAERDGVIHEILVENEQPVEYNQLLFLLEI